VRALLTAVLRADSLDGRVCRDILKQSPRHRARGCEIGAAHGEFNYVRLAAVAILRQSVIEVAAGARDAIATGKLLSREVRRDNASASADSCALITWGESECSQAFG
jgi:hypothetical protein